MMRQDGIKPNEYTYAILELRQLEDWAKEEVAQEMQRDNITPDLALFNTLLHSSIKAGDRDKEQEIYQQMRKARVGPDATTYAAMLRASLSRREPFEVAVGLLDEMAQAGLALHASTFNLLLSCCVKDKDHRTAALIIQEMSNRGVLANDRTKAFLDLLEYPHKQRDP